MIRRAAGAKVYRNYSRDSANRSDVVPRETHDVFRKPFVYAFSDARRAMTLNAFITSQLAVTRYNAKNPTWSLQ